MKLVWVHRNGFTKDGDLVDRHYLVDELSHLVLGHVDPPDIPFLCYTAYLYSGTSTMEYTDIDTAKSFLEAQAMIGKRDRDYSADNLETQHGDKKEEVVEVKELAE